MHMIRSGRFSGKNILIVDKEEKNKNDRTWCFWEEGKGFFEDIVYRKWDKAWIHSGSTSTLLDLAPYQYKMIRGIDFYEYCLSTIRDHPQFKFIRGNVDQVHTHPGHAEVIVDGQTYNAQYIFNSILRKKPQESPNHILLLQHFKGWIIKTRKAVFDPARATLMDFRTDQRDATAFVYIMPFSTNEALVEYTLFSKHLLQQEEYDEALQNYISEQVSADYEIIDQEYGVIPMTNFPFPVSEGRIINIGTAGGQTKASSGYTFRFIQEHSAKMVESLSTTGKPHLERKSAKFNFYDSVLLHILYHDKLRGSEIFSTLFERNKTSTVLKFLDNKTSLGEDLKLISGLPTLPFLGSAVSVLMSRIRK